MKAFTPTATTLTREKLKSLEGKSAVIFVKNRKGAFVLSIEIPMSKDNAVSLCTGLTKETTIE